VTSESIPGWAFLVARGRQTGYQLLLAPDFIMTGREAALLMDEVRGEVPMQGPPMVTDIAGPVSGPLCMVYRTVRATRGDVGAADRPEEPLLDRAGRPLVLTYGFICRGSRVVAPHDQDLRVARDAAVATYRRFHAAEETFPPETSRPYSVQSTVAPAEAALSGSAAPRPAAPAEPALSWPAASRSPAPWTAQTLPGSQQPALVRRRPAIVISLIAVVALFGLALGAYVLTHGRQAKPHRCPTSGTTAKPSPGNCGRSKPQSTRPPTKSPPASSRASFGKKAPGVIAAWERPAAIRRFLEFDVASPQGPSTPPTIESINFQHVAVGTALAPADGNQACGMRPALTPPRSPPAPGTAPTDLPSSTPTVSPATTRSLTRPSNMPSPFPSPAPAGGTMPGRWHAYGPPLAHEILSPPRLGPSAVWNSITGSGLGGLPGWDHR